MRNQTRLEWANALRKQASALNWLRRSSRMLGGRMSVPPPSVMHPAPTQGVSMTRMGGQKLNQPLGQVDARGLDGIGQGPAWQVRRKGFFGAPTMRMRT